MALNIVVSDTVRFKVQGTENDEHGVEQPFDFWLTAERLADADAVMAYVKAMQRCESAFPITEMMLPKLRGWSGIKGPDGQELPFSEDAFRRLMKKSGMAFLVHHTYLREVGVKEKN